MKTYSKRGGSETTRKTSHAVSGTIKLFGIMLLSVLLLAGHSTVSKAQEVETLIRGDVRHGGFGGPVITFGQTDGKSTVWVGGRGGWIINMSNKHAISLGGGGFGLVTEHRTPVSFMEDAEEFAAVGYGGFITEYTNRTYRLVHVTATSLIGAGGVTTRDHHFDEIDDDPSTFFVFEPGLHAEMNITTFFRISAGVTYRLTSGIDKAGYRDSDFSGLNGVLTFKFGAF